MSIATTITHEPRLAYSLLEAAQRLGVSDRFLRNEIKRGALGAVRRGKRVLIPAKDLDAYLTDAPSQESDEVRSG